MKPDHGFLFEHTLGIALGVLACALAAAYALWFSSAGAFPNFPPIQNDFVELGRAFLHGQASLLEQPDPRLATLANPYDYEQRKSTNYHWDASYYHGKYYLYWGPVPALVAAALQAISGAEASGSLLDVLPYLGLLAVFLGILIRLSRYFLSRSARLSLAFFVLLGLMSLPYAYVLGNARSYEAAVLYGQFFLMAGLLAWLLYATANGANRAGWLVAAGLSWGLALGSRYNLVVSVVIYTVFALVWIVRETQSQEWWKRATLFVAPIALCLLGMAIYNSLRFGNPLETGISYQLTIPQLHDPNFSFSYSPANLYLYLLQPLRGADMFPFMQAPDFHPRLVPGWLTIPRTRAFEKDIVGALPTVPGIWLLAIAIPVSILLIRGLAKGGSRETGSFARYFHFAMIGLAAAGQFLFLMGFFYDAERYWIDLYPSVILIAAMLAWRMDESLPAGRFVRPAFWLAVASLTLWTAGIYFFGSFGVPTKVLSYFDPASIASLATFWNERYSALAILLEKLGLASRLFS